MPNWCNNNLVLTHKDPAMMEKALQAWNEDKFLSTLVPEPDYTKVKVKHTFPMNYSTGELKTEFVDPEQAWWDWRVQNWGTKWDIGAGSDGARVEKLRKDGALEVFFCSAWSPPTEAYTTLVDMGFDVSATYYEGGCGFCGEFVDGQDNCFEIKGNSDWVRRYIPRHIDEDHCISEDMAEWEEENAEEEEDGIC